MLDGRVLEASQVEYKPFGKPPLQREACAWGASRSPGGGGFVKTLIVRGFESKNANERKTPTLVWSEVGFPTSLFQAFCALFGPKESGDIAVRPYLGLKAPFWTKALVSGATFRRFDPPRYLGGLTC